MMLGFNASCLNCKKEFEFKEENKITCCENPIIYIDIEGNDKKIHKISLAKYLSYKRNNFVKKDILNIFEEDKTDLKTDSYRGAEIFSRIGQAKNFIKKNPTYFSPEGLFWIWNPKRFCWEIKDEIDLLNGIRKELNVDIIDGKIRTEILQALKQVGRMNKPKDIPKTWIQFKGKVFDIKTGKEFIATPEYFVVNPIPYSLHETRHILTPTMDKLFEDWVGKDHVKTLYQIMAYCLLADYPLHRLFCFIGSGMNGKSCFLRIVRKFVGEKNCCSTELDTLLNSRFEITRLNKKLVCMMGETNFNEISKTSIIKKLTGQDLIGFEYKNKNPFEDKNYAKIMIATNNLPETTDKTIGFYRRWLIIDFPNTFLEEKDIISEIPEEEFKALASKCALIIIPELLEEKKFWNEGGLEERQKNYEEKSNPFHKFYSEMVDENDPNSEISKWEFEKKFNEWAKENRFRNMSSETIAKKMKERGILEIRPYKEWFDQKIGEEVKRQVRSWSGLKWK